MSHPTAPGTTPAVYAPAPIPVSQVNESSATAVAQRMGAEIAARTLVALNNRRNMEHVGVQLVAACKRFKFADNALYAKPMGKNKPPLTGLSIRFAEEVARTFGNMDVEVLIVGEDGDFRTIEARTTDLERNLTYRAQQRISKHVTRKFINDTDEVIKKGTNSRGETNYVIRATEDALYVEMQRAAAKATRDATLKHVPSELREDCEEEINRTLAEFGDKEPEKFLADLIQKFRGIGVTEQQIEEFLEKKLNGINVAELHILRRIFQGIKQGEGTWADVMESKRSGPKPDGPKPEARASGLEAALAKAEASTPPPRVEEAQVMETEANPSTPLTATVTKKVELPAWVVRACEAQRDKKPMAADVVDDLRQFREDNAHLVPVLDRIVAGEAKGGDAK